MQVQYIKEYSNCLDREMEYKIYGQVYKRVFKLFGS